MSHLKVEELKLPEEEFANISHRQLLDLFSKHKKITVQVGSANRMDLTYVSGERYGIKFTEVISLSHVQKLPAHYSDDPDDERYKTITDKPLSPLNFSQAVKKFSMYYKKLKQGKVMKIKDLTEDEIYEIVREMNKPIGDIDD